MVAITATNTATPSIQTSLGRARVVQARRQAEQAEANARDLRARADEAEQQADSSEDNLRKVTARVQQDELTYKLPATNVADVPAKTQRLIIQMYDTMSEARTLNGSQLKTDVQASVVVNGQGQMTGRIVNVSA